MGKTRRREPEDGDFKKLRGNKKQRTKKQRASKANLQKHMKFATRHRENIDMTQLNASLYMKRDLK